MAFKLPNIKDVMSRKYGTGDYSRTGKKFEQRMKPGESKFQYDVRMRKEGRKTPSTKPGSTKSSYQYQRDPDPNTEITGLTGESSWTMPERKPGDLREQHSWSSTRLPSAPGDEWKYEINQDDDGVPYLWAWDPDGKLHEFKPGSESDKAIRKRYTGSETGGLENWYGHDTQTSTGSYSSTDQSWEYTDFERKSYLPYDLAQKKYNPNYKGSKK